MYISDCQNVALAVVVAKGLGPGVQKLGTSTAAFPSPGSGLAVGTRVNNY